MLKLLLIIILMSSFFSMNKEMKPEILVEENSKQETIVNNKNVKNPQITNEQENPITNIDDNGYIAVNDNSNQEYYNQELQDLISEVWDDGSNVIIKDAWDDSDFQEIIFRDEFDIIEN